VNAVEIEEAVSNLALQPFDAAEFSFAFLAAFGNKETTIRRLRKGETNASDVPGGVLQRNNIHIAVCEPGAVTATLTALRASPRTVSAKAKFILATDGVTLEAEDLANGEPVVSDYADFPQHFGVFLPLAGISTVKEIKNNPIDVRATGRLNKLYVELLRDNPEWSRADRRHDMNHFMARLIFCFFAEKTGIFNGEGLFTATVARMSEAGSGNTHEIISTLFHAMNTRSVEHAQVGLPGWATVFPYVNGGLFSGSTDVPRFSRIARSYLLHVGGLDWKAINPDIFGSMIQAVADDDERGALGMHYTSVPNILKVLTPLFLDDVRSQLAAAGENPRMLLNLRKRMSKIRVFDPACGSGNFLVIAYKEMRSIEAEINRRRGEPDLRTEIPLTNFRGIELRDLPAEIARLALIIAEFQCDVIYRGQKEALLEFLPLDAMNWITCGNALRLDWLTICPPSGSTVKFAADDLFHTPLDQAQIDFKNEGGETYICGNPPYAGLSSQKPEQKADLERIFGAHSKYWKSYDYVTGWIYKAAELAQSGAAKFAFVSTNSIFQGQQVPMFWPIITSKDVVIEFAYESFKWANLASNNAGVTVVIVGLSRRDEAQERRIFVHLDQDVRARKVAHINPYLAPASDTYVEAASDPINGMKKMYWGCKPVDGGHLLMDRHERDQLIAGNLDACRFIHSIFGSSEFIDGTLRYCVWVKDDEREAAECIPALRERFQRVRDFRSASKAAETRPSAAYPHRFRQIQGAPGEPVLVVPIHSSETREWLPVGYVPSGSIISNAAFGIYNAEPWSMALLVSKVHLIWIATVCGKLETRYRYSNTLGWNTFPVPKLTEQNKADLMRCAENILLAREAHFPATIADLYDPEDMPGDLRRAHEDNDDVLERVYIGRRFRNDTERLEKLFELYTKMTAAQPLTKKKGRKAA
jgi:hypothetical protein